MRRLMYLAGAAAMALAANAQQALWGGSQVVSPEINPDNTVTFRLFAPDAKTVQVTGDFLPTQEMEVPNFGKVDVPGVADLTRGEDGVWAFTTPSPLAPELYSYSFNVDGLRMMDPSNVYAIRDVATVTNVFLIDGGRAHLYKVNDVPHGTVSKVWYDSPGLGLKRRMTVYTPPGYDDSTDSYPVFYLLHGAGGDEEAWMELGRASQILDNLIASGKAEPMIVVMTNGNPSQEAAPGQTSDGFVKPGMDVSRMNRGEFETNFTDVVNYIDRHYRTKADKAHRAIAGLSMGGFHSLHISKLYPDLFDYVGLFSAAIFPFEGREDAEVYKDMEGKLKVQFDKKPKLYYIAIGDKDFLFADNVKYRKMLDEKGYPYTYLETGDGHIWKNWRIYLSDFVPRLFKDAPQLGVAPLEEVIGAMTPEEKVRLMIGMGMKGFEDGENAVVGATQDIVPGAAGTTFAIPRLGIPSIVLADGPAGLRISPTREGDSATYYCTHFPIGTLLASSWDPQLVEYVGEAIGNEVLEYGADVLLAPALNIHRHPLNGRNFEYYSEDPLVAGKMAAAYVRGVQKNGVGTSIKHYAANNQETNRTANDARISPRALREIYLKGFETAVKESDPWTVMSSYNLINGVYTSEDPQLQTVILRDEWGYPGMVMTDWFGGKDAPAQVRAGNDMLQPGYEKQYTDIMAALEDGSLSMDDVDRNVANILRLIMRTPRFKGYWYSNKPDLKAHAEVTRQSATEGMVLLKNDNNVLPLDPGVKNVALFGCTSYDFIPGGTGSGNVNRAYTVSLLDGLANAGYSVDKNLQAVYEKHIAAEKERLAPKEGADWAVLFSTPLPEEITFTPEQLSEAVKANDAALITIGRNSGEFFDRKVEDFELSAANRQMLEEVAAAFHAAGKPVVVVMNVGGVIETESWKDLPDGILLAWQGGQEGGNSVADILSGKANPSGKLPMTFPVRMSDHYSDLNFPHDKDVRIENFMKRDVENKAEKDVDYTDYEEDIYVGYRYFDSFGKPVSYPFGYGLSYTTFEYGTPKVDFKDGVYTVKVDVKNTGKVAGKEVAQLYVAAPDAKTANKPDKELKAFAKTSLLQPGQTETLTLTVPAESLASYSEEGSAWVTTPGQYEFMVGASSRDIKGKVPVKVKGAERKTKDVMHLATPLRRLKR